MLGLWLLMVNCSEAQELFDRYAAGDSIFTDDEIETLVEQSVDIENSPLLDFLQVQQSTAGGNVEIRSRLAQQLQESRGYTEQHYLGTPMKSYQRITITRGEHVRAGILFEKDAGEQNFDDFSTGFVCLNSFGAVSSAVVGDYVVEAGQGLALWRGYDVSKGANVIMPAMRLGRELVPYASSGETAFLRGVAMNMRFPNSTAMGFYSQKSCSGSLDAAGNVVSIYASGYFRNRSEIEKRDVFEERIVGVRLKYDVSDSNLIGATAYTTNFSRFLSFGSQFQGNRYNVASADYNFHILDVSLFGECTKNSVSDLAGVSGVMLAPAPNLNLISVYRSYPANFFSLHTNGFGNGSGTSNEKGFYVGVRFFPIPEISVSSYFDQFRSFSNTSSSLYPIEGTDFLLQCENALGPRLRLTTRFQERVGGVEQTVDAGQGRSSRVDDRSTRRNFRLNVDYRLSSSVRMRGRFEFTTFRTLMSGKHETGVMAYNDLSFRASPRMRLDVRVVSFNTSSYDAGMGEYESDLPGVLAVPILYGRGVKWYILTTYSAGEKLEFALKYSDMIRDDIERLGTGWDELPTNHDNRVGVQLDVKF